MILPVLLAALLQSDAAAPGAAPVEAVYHVHGGDPIGRLLDAWDGEGIIWRAPGSASTADFGSCVARGLRPVDAECVRGLIPASSGGTPQIALVAHDSGRRSPVWSVVCVGPDGVGRARLDPRDPFATNVGLRNAARSQIADCISTALSGAALFRAEPPPETRIVRIPFQQQFAVQDVAEARRAASEAIVMSVDHLGVPRGNWGHCHVQGLLARVERGNHFAHQPEGGGTKIELSVPCGNPPYGPPRRQVGQDDLPEKGFIRLFLDAQLRLLDVEPLKTR